MAHLVNSSYPFGSAFMARLPPAGPAVPDPVSGGGGASGSTSSYSSSAPLGGEDRVRFLALVADTASFDRMAMLRLHHWFALQYRDGPGRVMDQCHWRAIREVLNGNIEQACRDLHSDIGIANKQPGQFSERRMVADELLILLIRSLGRGVTYHPASSFILVLQAYRRASVGGSRETALESLETIQRCEVEMSAVMIEARIRKPGHLWRSQSRDEESILRACLSCSRYLWARHARGCGRAEDADYALDLSTRDLLDQGPGRRIFSRHLIAVARLAEMIGVSVVDLYREAGLKKLVGKLERGKR